MLAAARPFCKADHPSFTLAHQQMRIARQRGQAGAVGCDEVDFCQTDDGFGLDFCVTLLHALHQRYQRRFYFAAQHGLDTQAAQHLLVHWRVQPVHAQMRVRRELLDARQRGDRDACGGMHRNVNRYQIGTGQHLGFEHLQRKVKTVHIAACALQPSGGFSQPKRLATQFVRINQDDFHELASRFRWSTPRHTGAVTMFKHVCAARNAASACCGVGARAKINPK